MSKVHSSINSLFIMASASLSLSSTLPTLSSTLRTSPKLSFPLHSLSVPSNSLPAFSLSSSLTFSRVSRLHPTKRQLGSRSLGASATDMASEKKVFDSGEDLAVSLAKYTADLSDHFAKKRGAFTVVLSGGSLIKCLRKLVEPPYIDSIDWSKWHVFWADERVVPKDHVDSNYKLAFDGFLSQVPILPGHVYAINDALSADGAADDYETCLKHLVSTKVVDVSAASGFPKFDLMLLGMGPDGHVASLFPGHPLLSENQKWVTFIKDSPKPPPERITFTFPVINSSAHIALVAPGASKADAVYTALGGGSSQNAETLPVQKVAPEGVLTWFLDKDAASKL